MSNRRFSGEISHYLCIFNGKFENKLAFRLQFARCASDFMRAFIVWQGAESNPAEHPTPNAASAGSECLEMTVPSAVLLPAEVWSATYCVTMGLTAVMAAM